MAVETRVQPRTRVPADPHEPGTDELARWLIPPGTGWRRRAGALQASELFWPLAGLALALIGVLLAAWIAPLPAPARWGLTALVAAGAVLLAVLYARIHRNLLTPLAHMRNWALRLRGGNPSARIPEPAHGEFAQLARDINRLSESLQRLSSDLESEVRKQTERLAQKTRSLEILYEVAAGINAARSLDGLLTNVLHILKGLVDARAATVRLLTRDGTMRLVASIGLDQGMVEREREVPVEQCLCGQVISAERILSRPDLEACAKVVGRLPVEQPGTELVAVPLLYHDEVLGVYNLFVPTRGLLEREDTRELLASIGRQLGMAIEKSRLDEETRQLSIMQERNMIAGELHDSLAQTLASLRFQVRMLDETLQQTSGFEVIQEIEQVENSLDEVYAELRALIAYCRAPAHKEGLIPAVESLAERFRKDTGIAVFLQKEWRAAQLPGTVETQVLRIVQEALANIRKHSKAQLVRILLRNEGGGTFRVLIEDDGVGFSEPADSGNLGEHVGLSIMQDRARHLGGELRVESEPGEGTRILLSFHHVEPEAETQRARESGA